MIDLWTVRIGLTTHMLLALVRGCFALPLAFAAGGCCYATGRVLTVRGRPLAGAIAHMGVAAFANLGNLALINTPV
jgi:hypothetical protein